MTDADLLGEAVEELYAADPESFTERRRVLAAQARAAGAAGAAKKIAALRKPTRSAWLVNRLVRADPSVPGQLSDLGAELRAAQAALDGARIRELSAARRRLIGNLVRQAFQLAGQQAPPAVLREELTATFGAALADPDVIEQLAAGTLVRAAHRANFTPGGPVLALVPPLADGPGPTAAPVTPARRPGKRAAMARTAAPGAAPDAKSAAAQRAAEQAAAERRRAQAEAERRRALAEAEQALADATRAADAAAAAEREQRDSVRALQEQLAGVRQQLADAQQRLAEARAQTRQAGSTRQKARRALDRLHRLGLAASPGE
jgi:chemotaxis protein histidine kinase CheA